MAPASLRQAGRREKQRRENPQRALKMHEARVHAPVLPLSHKLPKTAGGPEYYIGSSGWYYRDWRGLFYPTQLSTSRWFSYYADHFDTVELNAPFYSWPTIATVKSWIRQAGDKEFVYTVKVCELITHIKRFKGTGTLVKDFGYIADMLGPRMGCFLFQLPPSFHYTPARLRAIVTQLDHRRRNVVEFRHASWWNENVYAAFRKTGTIFCSCSGPKLPEELVKTADDIYLRFHGTRRWYRHDYTKEELAVWAERIIASDSGKVWVYFNNDYEGHAIRNAETLTALLKSAPE